MSATLEKKTKVEQSRKKTNTLWRCMHGMEMHAWNDRQGQCAVWKEKQKLA
jgi:hypothetical protein